MPVTQLKTQTIDSNFTEQLANMLLQNMTAGTLSEVLDQDGDLIRVCNSYYEKATRSLSTDREKTAAQLDTMKTMHVLARAYIEIIGLPKIFSERLQKEIPADLTIVLENPILFERAKKSLEMITQEIMSFGKLEDMPLTICIYDKMQIALESIQRHNKLIELKLGYLEHVKQWQNNLTQLIKIEKILLNIQTINSAGFSYFALYVVKRFLKACEILKARVSKQHEFISRIHAYLTSQGFELQLPDLNDANNLGADLFNHPITAKMSASMKEKIKSDAKDLGVLVAT